jgi:hypothetical protein
MAAVLVFLIVVPVMAAAYGYVTFGLAGGVLAGAGSLIGLGALVGIPFAMLVRAERCKGAEQDAMLARMAKRPPGGG